jgi:uncharacterized protein YggE
MSKPSIAWVALTLAVSAWSHPAVAQRFGAETGGTTPAGNIDGFTVAGKGSAAARPNRLEIELEVSAASELTADAIVKYRDAKNRIQEAFTALKMGNVSVEEKSLLVDQKTAAFNPYFMDTPPARRGKVEVQLSRKLVVVCTKIRDLDEEALLQLVARLLDVAQDAGGKVGGSQNMSYYYYYGYDRPQAGLVRFILDDFDQLQDQAYEAAITDARAKAGRLARLSGVELGKVIGVREVSIPGEKASSGSEDEPTRKRIETSKFQEIPVKVELLVRFDAGAAKPKGKEGGE